MAGKRGRPKLDKAKRQTTAVLVKMTHDERKLLGIKALQDGRPLASYLRHRGLTDG